MSLFEDFCISRFSNGFFEPCAAEFEQTFDFSVDKQMFDMYNKVTEQTFAPRRNK